MQFKPRSAPFLHAHTSINRVMLTLLCALLPAMAVLFYWFSYSVLIQLCLVSMSALLTEAICLALRKQAIKTALADLSALVTGVLLALSLPSIAPWWLGGTGAIFGIVIGKHVYGGLGYNPFNPAMVAYVFLLISFPQQMTAWPLTTMDLSFEQAWQVIFLGAGIDGVTAATFLDFSKTALGLQATLPLIANPLSLLSWAYLLGGVMLLVLKVIRWQIPVGVLGGLLLPASVCYFWNPEVFHTPWQHLMSGASLFCAFFIATDPVTAVVSQRGRLLYGLLIGGLIFSIRTWGGYPDGVAFAVLLANLSAPSIDYLLRPQSARAIK